MIDDRTPRFKHLSITGLIKKCNAAPDFGRDDEEAELCRRIEATNGLYKLDFDNNKLILIKTVDSDDGNATA